ncbi:hypothetical protein [Plasticicumulans sp.]|uniref:hypothetical protein n=1 Tax=Plasticicumulans sp. TaxID=2307179 RepID=UPI003931D9ED
MTAAARRDYLTAYRLQRLGARVPLRTDARAPLAVWAAGAAAQDAHRPDPLTASVRTRSGSRALALGLGLRLRLRLPLPLDPVSPPAAGSAAPVPAGLPAPATAQAHPPAQPDPSPSSDSCPCDACAGTGRIRSFAFDPPDEFDVCESCGSGFTEVDLSEPEPIPAKLLALSLAECVRAIDDFYHCQVSSDVDLHAALKAACQRARSTLSETGYSLSRWPF